MVIAVELVLLAAFIALTVIVTGHLAPLPGDVGLTLWWQHLVRPHHLLTTVFDDARAINFPSGVGLTLIVLVAVFALLRRWLDLLVAGAVLVANELVFFLINEFVRRPRPIGYGIVVEQDITKIYGVYSFPSGHVMYTLAFLGIVLFLIFQVQRPRPWLTAALWVVRIILLALIVLELPAAVLAGEHWPSDGLAGLLWGGFWLLVGIQMYRWAARRWPRLLGAGERREAVAHAV
jgi:undecaprenyl-diphosphatase